MEDHSRTIIHIDIDCFYAQVEMVRDPSLKDKPLGIQQKNIVVTSNYVAREYGIEKCMLITEAKKLCPNLVLVNGEDLYKYRQISYKVTSLLQAYSELVERLGLDENFIDITDLVNEKLKCSTNTIPIGHTFGETEDLCDCGCKERISIGSHIAQEIRNQIYKKLHLTVCAGIACNKLLAKIVGSKNKPNKQTLVFPNSAAELVLSLELVKNIPWIGSVSTEQLSTMAISKVSELQNSSIGQLKNIFGFEKAQTMWNFSFGIDNTPVKKTGKPQSIGLEDSCKALTAENLVEDKLKCLLRRLMILVKEDERIPKTVKVTVRKLDIVHPQTDIRETRQCNISTSLENEAKIMTIIMTLFRKAVDTKKKFHITLLGLSFTNFAEKTNNKNTLTHFFTRNLERPSATDFKNKKVMLPFTNSSTAVFHGENSKSSEQLSTSTTCNTTQYGELPKHREKIVMCPPCVNEEVFRELPKDVQEELWNDSLRKRELEETRRPFKKIRTTSILNYIVREPKKV